MMGDNYLLKFIMRNPLEPLPALSEHEIALMTVSEFLQHANPGNKYHPEDAYDSDLESLNYNYHLQHIENYRSQHGTISIYRDGNGFVFYKKDDDWTSRGQLIAILHQGTLYYENRSSRNLIPSGWYSESDNHYYRFAIADEQRVKYLQEYLPLINQTAKRNREKYPIVLQRIRNKGEAFEIRSKQPPRPEHGDSIAILNDDYMIVALASNEWGATLLQVAEEYRGRGLGLLLGKLWYHYNPDFTSGGFTVAGQAAAIARWESRVREFRANGWYRALLADGRISKERLAKILSGLRAKEKKKPKAKEEKPDVLLHIESGTWEGTHYWGPTFVIYDRKFYSEPDPKYIYGFGFFRDNDQVGSLLYRIEHDSGYQRLTTYLALQIARSNEELLYVGDDYGADMIDLSGIEDISITGDYVQLTRDVIDLEAAHFVESHYRRTHDPYRERYYQLLEMAESKWS